MRHFLALLLGGVLAGVAHVLAPAFPLLVLLAVVIPLCATIIGTAIIRDIIDEYRRQDPT